LPESANNYCFIEPAMEKELKKALFQIHIKMHVYDNVRLHQDFFLVFAFKLLIWK